MEVEAEEEEEEEEAALLEVELDGTGGEEADVMEVGRVEALSAGVSSRPRQKSSQRRPWMSRRAVRR